MKEHPIKSQNHIQITVGLPGNKQFFYRLPNNKATKESLKNFLDKFEDSTSDEAKLWKDIAKERIAKHSKAGLALRGARFREDLSQKDLAALVDISQDNISRMENGKRTIGEKTAKKLAAVLHADYRVFLSPLEKKEKEPRKNSTSLKKNRKK